MKFKIVVEIEANDINDANIIADQIDELMCNDAKIEDFCEEIISIRVQ